MESEAQSDYLSALDSRNDDRIREAGRRLTEVMTPGPEEVRRRRRLGRGTGFSTSRTGTAGSVASTATRDGRGVGSTPGWTPRGGINQADFEPEGEQSNKVDVDMSLGAFQAKYTSEDNESFNALLDQQNVKRAAKYEFFHRGNKIPTARQIAYRAKQQQLLEASSGGVGTSTALTTTSKDSHETTAVAALEPRPSQDLDARPASVDSFPVRQGPRNHFMFGPDGVEDSLETAAQRAEAASTAPPKRVEYAATRFLSSDPKGEDAVPSSPSMSAVDAAIAGRPRPTESEAGYSGAETPRVNGYAFVDAEPTPSEMGMPVTDEEADAAERAAAMALMPKVEQGGLNPFMLHEQSKREDLHLRLVEKADKARRKNEAGGGSRMAQLRGQVGKTPTPRFSTAPTPSARARAMTPAAQKLAQSIGTPRKGDGIFGKAGTSRIGDAGGWDSTPRVKKTK